jgi:predicted secreted protein
MKKYFALLAICATTLCVPMAYAQMNRSDPAPNGILNLTAQANREVPQDTIRITLFTEQQANDPARLAQQLNQRTGEALQIAKRARQNDKSDDLTLQTSQLSIYPINDKDGKISSWRGRSELVIQSRNFAAASQLATQLGQQMQVSDVGFSLSPQARQHVQTELTTQAIDAFRQQAQAAALAFGYRRYAVREVTINKDSNFYSPAPRMFMAAAEKAPSMDSLPVASGKTNVTVNVSGAVRMER